MIPFDENYCLDAFRRLLAVDSTTGQYEEIQKLLAKCFEDAKRILREHRALLDEIALYLLQKETITGDELMTYVNAEQKQLQSAQDHPQAADEAAQAPQTGDAPEAQASEADPDE